LIGKIIALLAGADGTTSEWRNRTITAYKRLTEHAEGLIAAASLRHQHGAGAGGACYVAVIVTGAVSAENKVGCQPIAKIEPHERDS
jgi:hypothetical protein